MALTKSVELKSDDRPDGIYDALCAVSDQRLMSHCFAREDQRNGDFVLMVVLAAGRRFVAFHVQGVRRGSSSTARNQNSGALEAKFLPSFEMNRLAGEAALP
ncbi:hypothetical protein AC630_16780 [Bradyrhizobium sp. AS23.2]|nr:hypothetical protein AC630_16780 [Bradyrhizobium sp. AS23.2]